MPALPRDVLARVINLIRRHPAVAAVSELAADGAAVDYLEVTFRINLPNAWMARGESPNGVRAEEVVRFGFPSNFPLRPPTISLRPDFDRNLPHIQPWLEDGRPVPCIVDGPLSELIHHDGLRGVLNQTAVWLDRAALGRLIDPEQGWEPVRRDELDDYLVADAGSLRSQVGRDAGYEFFDFEYVRLTRGRHSVVHGEISKTPARLRDPQVRAAIFSESAVGHTGHFSIGRSVALVVWSGRLPSGQPFVVDRYKPETVTDIAGLTDRAREYGCDRPLETALSWLKRCIRDRRDDGPFAMAIVLLARRPFKVIGTDSPLELCPYVADVSVPALFEHGSRSAIRPAGHRDRIEQNLLRKLAGYGDGEPVQWTLLGCGSLGSKIAMHLARAGAAPSVVVDKRPMSPHNAARHALVPPQRAQFLWTDNKASLLSEAIQGLGATPIAIAEDVVDLVGRRGAGAAWSSETWVIVNATASLNVREALSAAHERLSSRVIECSLFARGQIGLMTIEGPERNPDTGDLITAAYRLMRADPAYAALIFGEGPDARRERVGESCGSWTMVMSDARLSVFAASMSETLAELQQSSLPSTSGTVHIGHLSDDRSSLVWSRHQISPSLRANGFGSAGWRVHIAAAAAAKIAEDVARWAGVESGGVLMGRLSEAAKTFYVEDVLPAPEDSVRTAHGFTLGRQGLRQQITAFAEATGWSLYCLGTWHSHLEAAGASGLDRATAQAVSLARLVPSVLLIHTPRGYEFILAASAP